MEIHGFAPSPNTWKCRALAAHIGVPLDYVHVDLLQGAQRQPEFLALSPNGRTPVLVDGDFSLWESTAILHFIASKKPENSIAPNDPAGRADVLRWQSWQLAHWGADACVPLTFQNFVKQLFNMGPADEAVVAKATEVFNKEAQLLNAHLDGRDWLVGDHVTLADFAVGAPLFYAKDANVPVGDYPNIVTWFERLSKLPCWSETAPQMPAAA